MYPRGFMPRAVVAFILGASLWIAACQGDGDGSNGNRGELAVRNVKVDHESVQVGKRGLYPEHRLDETSQGGQTQAQCPQHEGFRHQNATQMATLRTYHA